MSHRKRFRYISLFSGIEAASLAWNGLGWEAVAFSEIEPFPCAVLAHRFPEVQNLGDITKIDWSDYADKGIDIIVGGSPCQSFSVAGKREGLTGASGLMFEYIRAVQEVMPRWIVWENVPGVLSSENGAAFGQLLRELDALGYGLAWRVLDAQFFGVAQRRRRVFLVGSLGEAGARRACEVLFEPDCLQGALSSSREKRKELAARAARDAGAPGGGGCLTVHQNQAGDVHVTHDLTGTLTADSSVSRQQLVFGEEPTDGRAEDATTYCIQGSVVGRTDENGPQGSGINEDISFTLNTVDRHAVTTIALNGTTTPKFSEELCQTLRRGGAGGCNDAAAVISQYGDIAGTSTARYDSSPCPDRGQNIVGNRSVVRRLTPRECERLQGMPSVVHLEVDSMTPDEIAACALASGDIFCDFETGTVYGTRGPGGKKLDSQ